MKPLYADDLANDLPDGWSVRHFDEVVYFQEGPGIRNWQYVDEGIPFVNIRCLVDGRLDRQAMSHVSKDEAFGKYRHFLLDVDDYVVSSSGTLGRIATVQKSDLPCMLNTSVIRMRPKSEQLDRAYLKYFLLSEYYQAQILSFATGSAQLNYGPMHLRQMFIVCPPLPEQRSIAHLLGTLDDKIELSRRMNETLEAMARTLFKSWFVDFDPVHAKAEGHVPGLPRPVADLFPDSLEDSEVGEIPKGWDVVPLPSVIDVNPSRSLRKGVMAPYLDMANMPTRGHTPDAVVDRSFGSGMRFVTGDTLVARITPCLENGKTAYVDFLGEGQVGWGSTEYIVLRPKPPLPPEFAYCLARSPEFREFAIQSMTGSSGRQRVPAESLFHFNVVIAPGPIAEAFGQTVAPLFRRASQAASEARTLGALRDTLLPKLVSGELRVRTPTTILEGAL